MSHLNQNKIILAVLPFWDPLVPPEGICRLKSYLEKETYEVTTIDANVVYELRETHNSYFGLLGQCLSGEKGNYLNVGHDVLRNHMMAFVNSVHDDEYVELIKIIVYNTFFSLISDEQVKQLDELLEMFFSNLEDYFLEVIERIRPRTLGISVMRDTVAPSLFIFRIVKDKYPDILTVMGGTIFSEQLRIGSPNFDYFLERTPFIDKFIIGEGQTLFLKLLEGELPDEKRYYTVEDINNKTLGFSSLNNPDLSDFNLEHHYPYLSAQSSKSCPYQCSFCNVVAYHGKYGKKKVEQTVREMMILHKKYGSQLFFMIDALLNPTIQDMSNEFRKQDISLYWDGYLRVDKSTCLYDNVLNWRRGGFYRARIGVETGSQKVLDLMDKKITVEQSRKTISNLARAGIKTTIYIVIGHPGETEEDFTKTLDLVEEMKEDIYEAECNTFIYSLTGQSKSSEWINKSKLLYPEEAKERLIIQTWIMDSEPSREVTFERMVRFVEHCRNLGIPNPYSLKEIHHADKRWKKLHRNAVPSLMDFKNSEGLVEECKNILDFEKVASVTVDDGDFDF